MHPPGRCGGRRRTQRSLSAAKPIRDQCARLPRKDETDLLGDIAICAPVAARGSAREQGKRLADHYAHLVIHGVLHLKGLDHETEADAVVMETQEARLLEGLGIADPYGCDDPLVRPGSMTATSTPSARHRA